MPPAAISRSSTYFPKICGNIANQERSALLGALLASLSSFACGPGDPSITSVSIRAHELSHCEIPRQGDANYTLALTALGPFRAGPSDTQNVNLFGGDTALRFSPETHGVEAVAATPAGNFIGYTERLRDTGIDVLLWNKHRACPLREAGSGGYPSAGAGQALGFSPALGRVLVAGEEGASGGVPNSLLFDADTGAVTHPFEDDRAYATVTPFADGFLLAGGENPSAGDGFEDRERWRNAYPYSLATGEFGSAITLQWDRTRHGALALPDGSTLLAGGYTSDGPVRQFEIVRPDSTISSTIGLASLTVGRLSPVVLRLEDGRILVGGGYLPIGSAVGTVEWFSADATDKLGERTLRTLENRVFVALPGGGALTVASCDACVPSEASPDCGCPSGLEATWLTPDDQPHAVALPEALACQRPARPLLFAGSDGAPWLSCAADPAVSPSDAPAPLFRFEAWPAIYSPGDAPQWPVREASPRFEGPSEFVLEPPPNPRVSPLSLGPDHFVWVSAAAGGDLAGARLDVRGSLSRDADSLLGNPEFRPLHLAPDRPVPVDRSSTATVPRLYDGVLTLSPSELTVWVTDTTYADVTITLTLARASDDTFAAPAIAFGGTLLGTLDACPWPALPEPSDDGTRIALSVVRRGTRVRLYGASPSECEVGSGALSVGFRAPSTGRCEPGSACTSVLAELTLTRD
jgi:hypothetical protein